MPSGYKGLLPASCHSDRPHYAKGLCQRCYTKQNRHRWKDRITAYHKRIYRTPKGRLAQKIRTKRAQLKKFNLTIEQYDELSLKQNHVCAICKRPNRNGKRLSVDHDHKTQKIRSLLCDSCNTAIGLFQESHSIVLTAAMYLEMHK